MVENGFNFGLGVIGAGIAWNVGLVLFITILGFVTYFLGYAYYWYKQKVRKCPKCGSKDYRYFNKSSIISDRRIEMCKCYTCNHEWEI